MKIIISALIIVIGCFLVKEYYIKNSFCKTEDGEYEIFGNTPINITKRIKSGDCECISETLIIEKKPNSFVKAQLDQIKKQLPYWVMKNYKNISIIEKENFVKELNQLSEKDFADKFKYRYTFFPFVGSVSVYTFEMNGIVVYCPNYAYIYDLYDGKYANKNDGNEPFGKKPVFPILESEDWAKKQFGEKGVVN